MTDIIASADPGFVIFFLIIGFTILFGAFMNWLDDRK